MKRKLSTILAAVVALSLLAGCGAKTDDNSTQTPANTSTTSSTQTEQTATTTANDANENTTADTTASTDEPAGGLPAMTTENITLRYAYWGQAEKGEPEVTAAQKKQFEDKYPNITLEFVEINQDQWAEALQNLAAAGTLPDVFGVFSVSQAVMNEWALPLNEMFEQDPDTAEMYPSFTQNSLINGVRYSMPWVMFPHLVFVNKTLFEKYNEPLPSYDWTVDEYFEIAKKLSHPEEFYFGTSNPIYEDLFPAWFNGSQGKWGWDGQNYNFDQTWADALNKKYELIDANILEWESEEDKERFLGDPTAWPPGWGRVAMHIDWPWSIAHFEDVVTAQSGCEFLYYPLPKGPTGKQLVIVDNAVIAASTEHPREAWELLKWTSWGEDAMLARQQAYRDAGANVSRMPVTSNQKVWDDLINNTDREDLKALYGNLTDLVPSPWPVSPGWDAIQTWINEQDIYGKIDRREVSPADVMNELNSKANQLKDEFISNIPN